MKRNLQNVCASWSKVLTKFHVFSEIEPDVVPRLPEVLLVLGDFKRNVSARKNTHISLFSRGEQ